MKTKFSGILTLFLAFVVQLTFAQEKSISGTISDENGLPLPGVNIVVKGTTSGTQSDFDGNYAISASTGDVISYSFVGYKAVDKTVGASNSISFSMEVDVAAIDEVVITALGIKRKPAELAYATTVIKQEKIVQAAPVDVVTALVGKSSGLNINISDNGVNPSSSVVLRGYGSISGNNGALIVIDGVPSAQTSLNALNANDIESVNILKGASSVTLYGSAGANGALIITTKRGTKGGKLSVSFDSAISFETVKFFPEVQTKYGSGSTNNFSYDPIENESWGPRYDGSQVRIGPVLNDGTFQTGRYAAIKDNKKDFFQTGITTQNAISISGGDEKSSYFFSAQNIDRTGVTPNDEYKRNNFRFNATREAGKLKVLTSVSFFEDKTDVAGDTPDAGSFYRLLLNTPGHIPLTQYRNWRTDKWANPNNYYNAYFQNPYQVIDLNRDTSKSNRLQGLVNLDYQFNDWISASYNLAGTYFNDSYKNTNEAYSYDPAVTYSRPSDQVNAVRDGMSNNFRLNSDLFITFDRQLSEDFSAKLILGNHVEQFKSKQINIGATNLYTNSIYNVGTRAGELAGNESTAEKRLYSYFADLTLGFRDYLYLTGSYRQDISSTLPSQNNSYGYYSGGLSFVATEAFPELKGDVLNYLKFNASYAMVGNDAAIGQINEAFQTPPGFPFGTTVGLRPSRVAVDPNLSPEFSTSKEAGVSAEFFDRRITLGVNYFTVETKDQINTIGASSASGATNYLTNVGVIENSGLEIDLNLVPIKTENFKWDLGVTLSTLNSEVISLNEGAQRTGVGASFPGTAAIFAEVGQPFPSIYAPGYQRDDQGRIIVGANGNPLPTSELINLGNTVPDFIAGLSTTFSYKGLSLSAVGDYKTGHVFYNTVVEALEFAGLTENSVSTNRQAFIFPNSVYNTGTAANPVYVENTNRPTTDGTRNFWQTSYNEIKENYVVDASAIKIREIALDYTLPTKLLENTALESVSLGLVANNLFIFTPADNKFTDPEFTINSGRGASATQITGIGSSGQAPATGTYGFKVNVKF